MVGLADVGRGAPVVYRGDDRTQFADCGVTMCGWVKQYKFQEQILDKPIPS